MVSDKMVDCDDDKMMIKMRNQNYFKNKPDKGL